MFKKNHFKVDDRVQMNRTTSSEIDGKYGTILGRSIRDPGPYPDFYIILLDEPTLNGDKAISLTEACIDRLSNSQWIIETNPAFDWSVVYSLNEGGEAVMTIFGQETEEDALQEAHYSLGAFEKDWYKILSVTKQTPIKEPPCVGLDPDTDPCPYCSVSLDEPCPLV